MLVNINAVCKLIKLGELEVLKLHGRTLVTRASVERLVEAKMAEARMA